MIKGEFQGKIAFVGNYLPRRCGIATFTTDLRTAVATQFPQTQCFAVAVTDQPEGYNYPEEVKFEIQEQDLTTYHQAAEFLNLNDVDIVSLQHEFGIFGGPTGSHILTLLRNLQMPIVTTLHTILPEPTPAQRQVMDELATLSARLVVMSERGKTFLKDVYDVPEEKIDLIPHGIPDVPFVDPNFYKDQYNVEGNQVLLTFGLLSPNKGIENVIQALPTILRHHPDVVYMVLGATHPHVKRQSGEAYRESLQQLAKKNGVADQVIFYNRFVSLEELVEFISTCDIYLTPYLNEAQIVSGTLAYTVGAGRAVISTPYWYAEELLAEGRGLLVPFNNPEAIANRVVELLDEPVERHAMRKRAYALGREMIWPQVADRYSSSFERARQERRYHPRPIFNTESLSQRRDGLPLLKLDHLLRLTDDTGMIQHATFTVPNYYEGYTTDDNARALILTALLEEMQGGMSPQVEGLAVRYLAFLQYAFNRETGRFRNFLSYDRNWLEDIGSEDSHGRSLWALDTVWGRSQNEGLRNLAGRLFTWALPVVVDFTSPRAWAFTLLGIHEYLRCLAGDQMVENIRAVLADRFYGR